MDPVSPDSVVLNPKQEELIFGTVKQFYNESSVAWYKKKGIPFRLGLLFHGPPGTGKTSTARVLASILGVNLYIWSPKADMTDGSTSFLFNQLSPRCVVCLDEMHNLGRNKTGVTEQGLKAAIDGLSSAVGRVVIGMTDSRKQLSNSLTRRGRFEEIVEFSNATEYQVQKIFTNIFTDELTKPEERDSLSALATKLSEVLSDLNVSPAFIVSHLIRHREDPTKAVATAAQSAAAWLEEQAEAKEADAHSDLLRRAPRVVFRGNRQKVVRGM